MSRLKRPGDQPPGENSEPAVELRSRDELRKLAEQYLAQGKVIPVLQTLNSIIGLGAANVDDWLMAGNTLLSVKEFAQAAGAFEKGLELDAGHAECRYNLATAQFHLGDLSSAGPNFLTVAERTNNVNAWMSLATVIPGWPEADHRRVLEIRKKFSAICTSSGGETAWVSPPRERPSIVRVGYVSAFFHRSNYMKPVWALLNGHDRRRFEIHLFADDSGDGGLNWFQPGPHDQVHLTDATDNDQMISLIRAQSLDILVDLNGYSAPSRLPVIAARLAPVGVAWFNMYATSGLPGMDWIVGDEFVIRPEEEPWYSERVRRLPQSYLSFVVGHEAPPVAAQPCLDGHEFTFGSLVSQYKITPAVLDAWSGILRLAPCARLILANRTMASKYNREFVLQQFEKRGVAGHRIDICGPAEHFAFLKHYDRIDIALDAFPYNGGTTTTEAIWQGVPVLTFDGDRWAARTSRSLLMNCHLAEFVASGVDTYIAAAVRWATDSGSHQRLAELRRTMRARLLDSPVCQTSGMVQAMEDFYREICGR